MEGEKSARESAIAGNGRAEFSEGGGGVVLQLANGGAVNLSASVSGLGGDIIAFGGSTKFVIPIR